MVDFPDTLPQSPLLDGYNPGMGDPFIRSNNETGPKIIRKRYTAVPDPVEWPIMVTKEQYATLQSFYKSSGHAPFNMTDPLTGETQAYRFTGPPEPQVASHNLLKVLMKLEKMP